MTYPEVYSPEVQAKLNKMYAGPCPGCGVEWGLLPLGHTAAVSITTGEWSCSQASCVTPTEFDPPPESLTVTYSTRRET
jgi:hypothetical protein